MFTLFLDCFSVLFVKIRFKLCEIRGTKRLFIDTFGHDVQQPLHRNFTNNTDKQSKNKV